VIERCLLGDNPLPHGFPPLFSLRFPRTSRLAMSASDLPFGGYLAVLYPVLFWASCSAVFFKKGKSLRFFSRFEEKRGVFFSCPRVGLPLLLFSDGRLLRIPFSFPNDGLALLLRPEGISFPCVRGLLLFPFP